MEIVLQVEPEIAGALCGDSPDTALSEGLREALEALHASASPLHPGASGELRTWFRVLMTEDADGPAMLERLSACPGVQAAYEKPEGEPPG